MLKSQKGSQRKSNVIALRSTLSRLASFDAAKLLDPPVIGLYCPCHISKLHALKLTHFHLVGRPVFNVAVFGDQLEYLYPSIPLQMHKAASLADFNFANRSVALAVRVNLPIAFELGQPKPSQFANGLQIIEAPIPAIEQDNGGGKASLLGSLKQLAEMIVFGRAIGRLIIETIVTRDVAVAIGPQKRKQVDATDHLAMFARPVAADQFNLFGVLLVESRIIQDQYARFKFNLLTRFLPEVITFDINPQKQAVDGIVSWRVILVWLHPSCFCAAIDSRRSNQKIDIVIFVALWSIHS